MGLNVLVTTGGHPFEEEPFLAMIDALPGIDWQHAPVPGARDYFRPERAGEFDAILCYEMQGIEYRKPDPPKLVEPPADYAEGFRGMLDAGQGIVFLHHAVTGWPLWPLWAEVVGGRGRLWEKDGWTHPRGSGVIGWVKTAGASPIVYFQPGHGPSAYANAGFRRVVANALAWVASDEAHRWAAEHATALAA